MPKMRNTDRPGQDDHQNRLLQYSNERYGEMAAKTPSLSAKTLWFLLSAFVTNITAMATDNIIDDRASATLDSNSGTAWRLVTDGVMGGVSQGKLRPDRIRGRDCLLLQGAVSTANNGGFVQMALELGASQPFDASHYMGLLLEVSGNGEQYNLHLRTTDLWLPWQSYRYSFVAEPDWRQVRVPFSELTAYRTSTRFDPGRLARIGLVAIGREFQADLCLGSIRFYGSGG